MASYHDNKSVNGWKLKNKAQRAPITREQAIAQANYQIHLRENKLDYTQAVLRHGTSIQGLRFGSPPPPVN